MSSIQQLRHCWVQCCHDLDMRRCGWKWFPGGSVQEWCCWIAFIHTVDTLSIAHIPFNDRVNFDYYVTGILQGRECPYRHHCCKQWISQNVVIMISLDTGSSCYREDHQYTLPGKNFTWISLSWGCTGVECIQWSVRVIVTSRDALVASCDPLVTLCDPLVISCVIQ